jgi:hypothetical protein
MPKKPATAPPAVDPEQKDDEQSDEQPKKPPIQDFIESEWDKHPKAMDRLT